MRCLYRVAVVVVHSDDGRMLVQRNPKGTFVGVELCSVETSANRNWTHQIIFSNKFLFKIKKVRGEREREAHVFGEEVFHVEIQARIY